MGYELHIERPDGKLITLSEWRSAVEFIDGVRLFVDTAHTITNPETGEFISIDAHEGDAQVFFPDTRSWHDIFRWRDDSAVFSARFASTKETWSAAVALASRLGAVIRGDAGETHDF